jgi:hypothetical protein
LLFEHIKTLEENDYQINWVDTWRPAIEDIEKYLEIKHS